MNIAILKDKKGFQKEMVLPHFLPRIVITVPHSVQAFIKANVEINEIPRPEEIVFYPIGDPREVAGAWVLEYRED